MSTSSDKSNLARIRENQRRSRARRREYVQELEQRLRLVEIQGIEASAEIQVVARKVAEENKKLRVLLNKSGVKNDTIESFLASSSSSSASGIAAGSVNGISGSPGRGGSSSRTLASSTSAACCSSSSRGGIGGSDVQELEQLLAPRRPSWCDGGVPSPELHSIAGDEGLPSRDHLPSVGSLGVFSDHHHSGLMRHHSTLPEETFSQLAVSEHQRRTAAVAMSPTLAIPRSSAAGSTMNDDHGHHSSRLYAAATTSPYSMDAAATARESSHDTTDYSYGGMSMSALHHSPYQQHHGHHGGGLSTISVQSYSPSGDSSAHSPISSTSCSMAANVISSMVGGDPFQVRATLGCPPGVDCVVDNRAVSSAIDQMTATALGM